MVITLVCVGLGLTSLAPGLLVPYVLVVVPALIRARTIAAQETAAGHALTTGDRVSNFMISAGIVVLVAASVAVYA